MVAPVHLEIQDLVDNPVNKDHKVLLESLVW